MLIDPVNHGSSPIDVLEPVAEVLAEDEWILHAADQDLPCLAEVGLRPPSLYDTELAGRLAGFERVNLAAMVQRLLGLGLAKGHGAADWSKRPLPPAWLNYAALDVEVLIELRESIAAVLAEQNKTDWAAEEFEYLRCAESTPGPRRDRWRRTSGLHKVRTRQGLAAVRELWTVRDQIARAPRHRPRAHPARLGHRRRRPGRPQDRSRNSPSCRSSAATSSAAARTCGWTRWRPRATTPTRRTPPSRQNGPPPAVRWAKRKPEAAARLDAARAALTELSARVSVPTENLVSPDLVRRLCWDWQDTADAAGAVDAFLRDAGARVVAAPTGGAGAGSGAHHPRAVNVPEPGRHCAASRPAR